MRNCWHRSSPTSDGLSKLSLMGFQLGDNRSGTIDRNSESTAVHHFAQAPVSVERRTSGASIPNRSAADYARTERFGISATPIPAFSFPRYALGRVLLRSLLRAQREVGRSQLPTTLSNSLFRDLRNATLVFTATALPDRRNGNISQQGTAPEDANQTGRKSTSLGWDGSGPRQEAGQPGLACERTAGSG